MEKGKATNMNSNIIEIMLMWKTQDATAIRVTNSCSCTFTHTNQLFNNKLCYICVFEALYQKEKWKKKK